LTAVYPVFHIQAKHYVLPVPVGAVLEVSTVVLHALEAVSSLIKTLLHPLQLPSATPSVSPSAQAPQALELNLKPTAHFAQFVVEPDAI
jgi:hypothetical protein